MASGVLSMAVRVFVTVSHGSLAIGRAISRFMVANRLRFGHLAPYEPSVTGMSRTLPKVRADGECEWVGSQP